MILSFELIKKITVGAVAVYEKDSLFHFQKCTDKQIEAFAKLNPILGERAKTTTGIRFDFHTNSSRFFFSVSSGRKFDLYINGVLYKQYVFGDGVKSADVSLESPVCKAGEDVRITLYFPAHDTPAVIERVEVDDGSYIRRHEYDRRILFLGDSITQGWNAKYDSFSFANRLSRMLNAESVVNGVGGAYFDASVFDSIDMDPDTVIIAYGTNDFSARKSLDSLRENVSAFLSFAENEYVNKNKKVYAISPIARGDIDSIKPMGSFYDCRRVIIEEIEKHRMIHIDGLSLLPYSTDLFADALHPNDLGFAEYAESLSKYTK